MSDDGALFLIEEVVKEDSTPQFAKLIDIHMGLLLNGKERNAKEFGG